MNDLKTLDEIFKSSIFRIPNYQRGYSWQITQVDEFLEDLIKLPDGKYHYTGMLSLNKLEGDSLNDYNEERWLLDDRGYTAFHVVDGQQRLTTIIMLIQAIVELYRDKNVGLSDDEIIISSYRLSEVVSKYLVMKRPDTVYKTYLFGYEANNESNNHFRNKILNSLGSEKVTENFYTFRLDDSKAHLKEEIEKLYKKTNDFSEIEKLFKKLTLKLKFSIYVIGNDFNINVAFETMNNRGKKLTTLELLKNRLMYLTSLLSLKKEEENYLIDKINTTWMSIYNNLGKSKDSILEDDEFLLAHSYIYFGYNSNIKKGYSDFLLKRYFNQSRIFNVLNLDFSREDEKCDNFDNSNDDDVIIEYEDNINVSDVLTKRDIFNYISSLEKLVPYWYTLNFQDSDNKNINEWLLRLKRLDISYFKPLVLVVLAKNDISDEKKIEVFKSIERFVFINFKILGYQAGHSKHIYYKFTNMLYNGLIDVGYIIDSLNNIDALSSNKVIDMNSGVLAVVNRLFKLEGFYRWSGLRYFLYEYESFLLSSIKGTPKIIADDYFDTSKRDSKNVSIEHIYPQSEKRKYWQDMFDKYDDITVRNRFRGSIGNLLPLAVDVNRDLLDYEFDIKCDRYRIGSYSEMEVNDNKQVNDDGIFVWNDETILERGLKLVAFLEDRWDFKFKSKYDKMCFLGLEFMAEENDKAILIEPIFLKNDINKVNIFEIDASDDKYQRKDYDIDYHLDCVNDDVKDLYKILDNKICEIDSSIVVKVKKYYVGYEKNNNFVEVHFKKNFLHICVLPFDNYMDPLKKLERIPDSYRTKLNMKMEINNIDDIDYAILIIKQSYELVRRI